MGHNGRIKIEEDLSLPNLTFPDVLWETMVTTKKGRDFLHYFEKILPHASVKLKCVQVRRKILLTDRNRGVRK